MKQISDTVLMIRPLHFRMNEETSINNHFQQAMTELDSKEILLLAQTEFDEFVSKLKSNGVKVIVIDDRENVKTPDSIFPNNWISFHSNGDIAIFPMFAENRRLERREDLFDELENQGYIIERIIDLSDAEKEGIYLEGTGSMVLDRENAIAYCALSERSDKVLLEEFCEIFGYRPISFSAYHTINGKRLPIYHTNVLLTIGETFAIFCADSIDSMGEREKVIKSLKRSEKDIIYISESQMNSFAGNMLQVIGKRDTRFLVMSATAFNSLSSEQIKMIEQHTDILTVEIPTIEKLGGGSARCMMAEVFLPNENEEV